MTRQCTYGLAEDIKKAIAGDNSKDPSYPKGCTLNGNTYDEACCQSIQNTYDPYPPVCPYDMLDPVGKKDGYNTHCNFKSARGNVRGNEKSSSGSGLSTGAIVGISVGGFILIVILVWLLFLRKNKSSDGSSSFSSSN